MFDGDVAAGLGYALPQKIHRFEFGSFGCDQSENDKFIFRYIAQRFEGA